jgi:hypothetical protein
LLPFCVASIDIGFFSFTWRPRFCLKTVVCQHGVNVKYTDPAGPLGDDKQRAFFTAKQVSLQTDLGQVAPVLEL